MLENIETLRRRPMVYATWSGVDNLYAAPTSTSDPAPAVYIGNTLVQTLVSPVYIPHEAFDAGSDYVIKVWLKLVNIGATYPSVSYEIMGQVITVTANGWSSYEITVRPDQDEEMSQLYNLSIYRTGFDRTPGNNLDNLAKYSRNPITDPTRPWIQGFCIWGV